MSPASADKKDSVSSDEDGTFLCGVVEGFYGRPWTTEQRKELFTKMQAWGTNSYLYAPKDDCKHRAYWREPYTVDEAEHLGSLIYLAAECNIDFYYAISPGLDITYSSPKEVSCLKRKLEQVAQLGCRAFALLFDDIEPEMCKQDKEVFQSFAHAQVSVTNEIFQHLGQPKFLFCPTQYCTARAVPTVCASEYLITIGSKLAPEIKIMWTGDKVISKLITSENLHDINDVLKRKCVIWDNEHANDYDQKRVFLGPYSGRSPEVKSKLSGVMTNPNCEYGANFIAIHTLAQWSKCSVDGTLPTASSDTVSSDIKLENEDVGEGTELSDICLPPNVYHPRHALMNALKDWLPEFSRQKTVWGPMSKPQVGLTQPTALVPGVNTCMVSTNTTTVLPSGCGPSVTETISSNDNPDEALEQDTSPQPESTMPIQTAPTPTGVGAGPPGIGPTSSSTTLPLTPSSNPSEPVTLSTTSLKDADSSVIPHNVDTSALQPITLPVMNSLVSTNKVVVDASIDTDMVPEFPSDATQNPLDYIHKADPGGSTTSEIQSTNGPVIKQLQVTAQSAVLPKIVSGPTYTEPMDCLPNNTGVTTNDDSPMESAPTTPMVMPVDETSDKPPESPTMMVEPSENTPSVEHGPQQSPLMVKDLLLLSQMFYLPSEHGQYGLDLLNEFYWLKRNGTAMLPLGGLGAGTKEDREEWQQRAMRFDNSVKNVVGLFEKLCACQNRELVYDLYTYVWDMCSVILTLNGFVQWLSRGVCSPKLQSYVVGQQTWFSGIREAFLSGDHEPWVFRGGLISDLLRLLPLDSGHDLYMFKYPEVPLSLLYNIRPFEPKDEAQIYALAANLYEEEIEAPMGLCESDRLVVGDKRVGAYLTLFPEYCFVTENMSDGTIVAFALTCPDATHFYTRHNVAWLPEMRQKYPRKVSDANEVAMLSPIEEMMLSFHLEDEVHELPACLTAVGNNPADPAVTNTAATGNAASAAALPWGKISLFVATSMLGDQSVTKRLAMLSMACLRASGTIRAFAELKSRDLKVKELYESLGFSSIRIGLLNIEATNPTNSSESVPNTDTPTVTPEAGPAAGVAAPVLPPTVATPNSTTVTSDTSAKFLFLTRSF